MFTFSINKDMKEVVLSGKLTVTKPTTQYGREWLSEAWFKSLEGKTDEHVNIDAYGFSCERNERMSIAKKETPMLNSDELKAGKSGVSEVVAVDYEPRYATLLEKIDGDTKIDNFINAYETLLIEEGVNIWKLMKLAGMTLTRGKRKNVNYDHQSIVKLRQVIAKHELSDIIKEVLSDSKCYSKLEGMLA